jgi:hypothetical protein
MHIVWLGGTGLEYQVGQLHRLYPGYAIMSWATGQHRSRGIRAHHAGHRDKPWAND